MRGLKVFSALVSTFSGNRVLGAKFSLAPIFGMDCLAKPVTGETFSWLDYPPLREDTEGEPFGSYCFLHWR